MFTTLENCLKGFLDAQPEGAHKADALAGAAWRAVAAPTFYEHTDAVFWSKSKKDKNSKTLVVYLDNSVVAAALNMERDSYKVLLERQLAVRFDEVKFLVSTKRPYKPLHEYLPFPGAK